ncbi:MAG: septum formation initiator family protein [Acutalibacteraceae bacterium]|nr:septum formation initiator family protein [Oscillospiraceae bacterium]
MSDSENIKKKRKKKRATSRFVNALMIVAAIVLLANFFSLCGQLKEKKEKYDALEQMYQEELLIKNEYEYLLDDKNRLEYIERIAREKYGYVAPGERAFYDSSYGK